eukprot:gene28374-34256_t
MHVDNSPRKSNEESERKGVQGSIQKHLKTLSRAIPVALGALALLAADPIETQAASSGGRSGGSSFRSSPSSRSSYRSSSRLNSYSRSYSTPLVTPIMPVSPFYMPINPFFGGWGWGLGLGGGGVSFLFNSLVFFALASVVFNLVQRAGGRAFGGDSDAGAEGLDGVTVVKLQLLVSEDWARSGNLMDSLSALARSHNENASLDGDSAREGLSRLLRESLLLVQRRQRDWDAASVSAQHF